MSNAAPEWRFSQKAFSDMEQEVTEADLFNTEKVDIAEALIREAAQNSQDAAREDDGPVRLRIAFIESPALDVALLDELTAALAPRIDASGLKVDAPTPSVLVIEDFGTRGLTGATDDPADKGNYRSFFFRHGGSAKRGGKLGRWGLGKLVFPVSSSIRCFFGLTVREDDRQAFMLGQAVLKTHALAGVRYAPHGHYGVGEGADRVMPVSDPSRLERIRKGFGLLRTDEPGLSVVVPYPVRRPDKEALLRFVIQNYAFPILTGRLEVDVLGVEVTAASVRQLGSELLKPGLVRFIDTVHGTPEADIIRLPEVPYDNGYAVRDTLLTPETLQELRQRYADGDLLGLRLPLQVMRQQDKRPGETFVDIFLQRAAEGETGDALCVRGDITIPGVAARFAAPERFILLRARDSLVSEFLGDAENPAHTEWSPSAERFTKGWRRYAPQTLSLIRSAPAALHRLLSSGQDAADPNALLNFFFLEEALEERPGEAPRPRRKKKDVVITVPQPPVLPQARRRIRISHASGGFRISAGPDFADVQLPARLRVEMAYDVERGNALKDWERYDFDLGASGGDIVVETLGADYEAHGQRIELDIEDPAFELEVSGFDPQRDLVVQSTWPRGATTDA